MHRKILKNSHKITNVKSIVDSNFYNFENKIESSNARPFFANLQNNSNFLNVMHNNFDILNLNNNSYNTAFANLTNYEDSYFWFLKRFYFLNTLNNNKFYLKISQKLISLNVASLDLEHAYDSNLNYIFKNNLILFKKFDLFLNTKHFNSFVDNSELKLAINADVFLSFEDTDLLSLLNLNLMH